MEIKFFVVPDYICTGVVEHYFKLSVMCFTTDEERCHIFSVIINKKTHRIERQAKLDVCSIEKRCSAIFGYGKTSSVEGFRCLNVVYKRDFTDEQKEMLEECVLNLKGAIDLGLKKNYIQRGSQISDEDEITLKHWHDCFRLRYKSIKLGTYVDEGFDTPKEEKEDESVASTNDGNAEKDNADDVSESMRKTIQVARMENAKGLDGFVNGNIYKVEMGNWKFIGDKTYVPLVNEDGTERRYVLKDRIKLVEQFDEPPTK